MELSNSYLSQQYSPEKELIAWLEFELAYYDFIVHNVSHYTTKNHSNNCQV